MTDCPPRDELAGLLNETCGAEQRERLEEHLGECERCQREIQNIAVDRTEWDAWEQRLRSNGHSWAPATQIVPDEADPENWPVIPGYELLDVLGRGGMGIVFKARQITLSRLVALKTLPLSGSRQGELRNRLLREAETLARLHHPHIVQIFEVLEADGSVVLALELIHGGNLAERLHQATLGPAEAARLVELLARTMQVAHDANILHRDLKPANVMLTADGVPKITDFGLARQQGAAGDTRTGHVIGTPSYLSPEQAQGMDGWNTPAVDIYALGAVLYECLTGRPPFRGENSFETLRQVIQDEPPSPSRLQPNLPRDLVTICLKCLQKDRTRRYRSCTQLADDLQRFQSGRPILARRTSVWGRTVKWARRHPRVAGLTATLVVTVAVLLGLWINFTRRITRLNADLQVETQRANDGERTARKARETADLHRRLAESTLLQVSAAMRRDAGVAGGRGQFTLTLPHTAYAQVLSRFDSPRLREDQTVGYHWLGCKVLETGDAENAAKYLERAVNIRRPYEIFRKRDPARCLPLAVFLSDYGHALLKLKRYADAEKVLREAVSIFADPESGPQERETNRNVGRAYAMLMLAAALSGRGRRKDAVEMLQSALLLEERLSQSDRSPEADRVFSLIRKRLQTLQQATPSGRK